MKRDVVLVTGAGGELGSGLIPAIAADTECSIVAVDRVKMHPELERHCEAVVIGDICDEHSFEALEKYHFSKIFHLASLLSSGAERDPQLAQRVNVQGSLNCLELARKQTEKFGEPTVFIFPSTIAVYGVPPLERLLLGPVSEDSFLNPITMYGVNKLYVEHLGRYYAQHYGLLQERGNRLIDFRALRFPGILSATTLPSAGTSDYGPHMLHAAARGEAYACFVEPETKLPFMALPDAVEAVLRLAQTERRQLSRTVYNVNAFTISAQEICEQARSEFHGARISFEPDKQRLAIVNSWPAEVDDSAARNDWGWRENYDKERTFKSYLVPVVKQRYSKAA